MEKLLLRLCSQKKNYKDLINMQSSLDHGDPERESKVNMRSQENARRQNARVIWFHGSSFASFSFKPYWIFMDSSSMAIFLACRQISGELQCVGQISSELQRATQISDERVGQISGGHLALTLSKLKAHLEAGNNIIIIL